MPLDFNRLADFDLSNFGAGVLPDVTGDVVLSPKSAVPDQFFRDLQGDGSPNGWSKESGATHDGYVPYLFEVSGGVRTGGRQIPNADGPEVDTHLFNTPLVSGGPAPTPGQPGVAMPTERLEAPVVTKVATGISGLPQGEYLAAISLERYGTHTLTTTPVQVSINADGRFLEFKLLVDIDRTLVTGQGLWLSAPALPVGSGTPDPTTMRLQDVAPATGRSHVVKGPYRYNGRLAPTVNETMIGAAKKLNAPEDYKAEGGKMQDLRPGYYVFYMVETTPAGESLPSPPSKQTTVSKVLADTGIVFHPNLSPRATGYRIFHQNFMESSNPPYYELVRTRTGDKSRPFTPTEQPVFFGKVDDGEITGQIPGTYRGDLIQFAGTATTNILVTATSGGFNNGIEVRLRGANLPRPLKEDRSYWVVNKSGTSFKLATTRNGAAIDLTTDGGGKIQTYKVIAPPENFQFISIQGDPPTEDTSGIADPTGEADAPLVVGLPPPGPGTYLIGYTRVLGGQETPLSKTTRVTLTQAEFNAGTVLQMEYPPRVNKIPNALYGQTDTKGLPLHWTVRDSTNAAVTTNVSGQNGYERAGVYFVQTNGTIAADAKFPNVQTKAGKEIAVDPERIETIAGWLEVTARTGGNGYVEVVQLDANKADLGLPLTLATLSVNGGLYFEKTIALTGADLTLNAATAYIDVKWGAQGANRNLRVRCHSLIHAPQKGVSRRYLPPDDPSDYWVPSLDPATPWPNTHTLAIGPPPQSAASIVAETTTSTQFQSDLIDYITFENQAFPTGWAITRSPVDPGVEAQIVTGGSIEGTYGFRIRDDYAGIPNTYAQKNYPVATYGANLSFRFLCRISRRPTGTNSIVVLGGIGSTQYDLPGLYLWNDGTLTGFYSHTSGTYDELVLISGLTNGTILDCEVVCQGLGTTSGVAEWWIGVNGAARTRRWRKTTRNWSATGYKSPWAFIGNSSTAGATANSSFTIDFDTLAVTKSLFTGSQIIQNTSPALTALVQPDYPWFDGTNLGSVTPGTPVTITTGNRPNLAAAATFNRSSAVGAERTLMEITNSAGTQVLVGLYMKLTSHDVELRKGGVAGTAYQAAAAVPTGTNYRFDLIVEDAGTNNGKAFLYRTIGTGPRELLVLIQNQDFTAAQAQRVSVPNNTELTETSAIITEHGEFEYDNVGPDNNPIYQGYVNILAADMTQDDVGFTIEEYVVKPGVERTFAVFMRPGDLNANAAPFTIIAYNEIGQSVVLGSAFANGTAVANAAPGWSEYWMTYTAPESYYRVRVESRDVTTGRYVFQKALDAVGNLNTTALRAAARDDRKALTGTYVAVLNSRVPQTNGTMVQSAYGEQRIALGYHIQNPTGAVKPFTVAQATDVFTATNHRYQNGSAVRVSGLTNAAPLAADTTYWVRDVTADTFKLAATNGGAAINITTDGSGNVFGYTFATARYYATDNPDVAGTWYAEGSELSVPDQEWIFAELTLYGDGLETPRIPLGSPFVAYRTRMPVLLRRDRTALPGGVYIGGGGYANNLGRPFKRSLFDEEAVGDRALPRAITGEIGRLWGHTYNIFQPEALDELQSNAFLEDEWIVESPFWDLVMRIRHYGAPSEPAAMFEYEGFDERSPFTLSNSMPLVLTIERAEVLAIATLSASTDSDLEPLV